MDLHDSRQNRVPGQLSYTEKFCKNKAKQMLPRPSQNITANYKNQWIWQGPWWCTPLILACGIWISEFKANLFYV